MRLILGIGNPGVRYKRNRHNVGFMALDYFSEEYSLSFKPSKGDYYFAEGSHNGSGFCLVKPTTFVNNSGVAAAQVVDNYKVDLNDFLVVVDDINLRFPEFRIRLSGGDGGHNGLSSIIYHLQSNNFPRLRIGIGKEFDELNMVSYVLSDFDRIEMMRLKDTFKSVSVLLKEFITGGTNKMLNTNSRLFNSKKDEENSFNSNGNQE